MKKRISILGSTGSIGENTLKILRRDKKDFEVNEVDPISKACQDYLKSEDEINNLELMLKSKKESLRQQKE